LICRALNLNAYWTYAQNKREVVCNGTQFYFRVGNRADSAGVSIFIIVFDPVSMAEAKDDARHSISPQRPVTVSY